MLRYSQVARARKIDCRKIVQVKQFQHSQHREKQGFGLDPGLAIFDSSAHTAKMGRAPQNFTCPGCAAHYKIVRMKSDPGAQHGMLLHCMVCKQPLAPTEGDYVLKYFLVSRPIASTRRPRDMASDAKKPLSTA